MLEISELLLLLLSFVYAKDLVLVNPIVFVPTSENLTGLLDKHLEVWVLDEQDIVSFEVFNECVA